jgi:HEAT repeat protein
MTIVSSDVRTADHLARLCAPSKSVRRDAARALASAAKADAHVRDVLCAGLESRDSRTRFACAFALAHAGADGFVPHVLDALCEALDADDSDERWAAAAAIGQMADASEPRVRMAKMARAAAPRTRRMALYCLRDLGGSHDCGLGADASRDPDAHVRLAALAMIARSSRGCTHCAAVVLERLEHDQSAGVRRSAAAALGRLAVRSTPVLDALARAATERSDAGLSRAARDALARLRLE